MDYAKLASTAQRLIQGSGRLVQIQAKGTFVDVTKPWLGYAPAAAVSVFATISNYNRKLVNGSSIQDGDQSCFIAANDAPFDLTTAELVTDGDRQLKVVGVRKVQPGGTALVYELQLR